MLADPKSAIWCTGILLHIVQTSTLYHDAKTFVYVDSSAYRYQRCKHDITGTCQRAGILMPSPGSLPSNLGHARPCLCRSCKHSSTITLRRPDGAGLCI